jgi:hypothetical protein
MGPRIRALATLAVGFSVLAPRGGGPARAADTVADPAGAAAGAAGLVPAPLRVMVRLGEDTDQKVLARLRGHASDLAITFVTADDDARPAGLIDQIAGADALAAREKADAVIWFSYGHCGRTGTPSVAAVTGAGGAVDIDRLVVHIGQPKTRSVLVRAVGRLACGRGAAAAEDSAAFEAAAIVVRAALVAIAEGGSVGVVPPSLQAAARTAHLAPRLAVGWLWTLDGLSPHGQQGLQANIGFGGGDYGIEMALLATVPAEVSDDFATLSLSRAALTLGGVVHHLFGERWTASAALHAGAVLQMRTTTPRMPGVTAAPASRLASLMVAPEGRLAVAVPGMRGMTAGIGLAADYIPYIPVITYTISQTTTDRRRPWVVQPRASLSLELALP